MTPAVKINKAFVSEKVVSGQRFYLYQINARKELSLCQVDGAGEASRLLPGSQREGGTHPGVLGHCSLLGAGEMGSRCPVPAPEKWWSDEPGVRPPRGTAAFWFGGLSLFLEGEGGLRCPGWQC